MTLSSLRGPAPWQPSGSRITAALLALPTVLMSVLLVAPAAQAHHLMKLLHLQPTPLNGLISGLLVGIGGVMALVPLPI